MRVIAGRARGRRLRGGPGQAIRPTASKTKGAIFSILFSRYEVDGVAVLDLFSGAGSLGIEALSRGAARATFIDVDPGSIRILRANLESCGFAAESRVVQGSLPAALRRLAGQERFGGVFLDPPYEKGLVQATLGELGRLELVEPGGWVVAEHSLAEAAGEAYGRLRLTHARRYGKTALAIFVCDAEVDPTQAKR